MSEHVFLRFPTELTDCMIVRLTAGAILKVKYAYEVLSSKMCDDKRCDDGRCV